MRRAGATPVIYDVASQAPGNRLLCLELDQDTGCITWLNYIPMETSDRVISQDCIFHATRSANKQTSMSLYTGAKITLPAQPKLAGTEPTRTDSIDTAAATVSDASNVSAAPAAGTKARAKKGSATATAAASPSPSALKKNKNNSHSGVAAGGGLTSESNENT